VPRPNALPATTPTDGTRKWLPPPCGPRRPDCRDGVRAIPRGREWPPGEHLRAVRRFLRAISTPGGIFRKFLAPGNSATERSQSACLRSVAADAASQLRVLLAGAPTPAWLRRPFA